MRQSHLFGKTVREKPKDVVNKSTEYLVRAGFIRESVAGRYYMLPLGMRVQDKIVALIEQEMNASGAQKMIAPTLHPLELWEETNRTSSAGFELMRVKDRHGAAFALGGTAEEMFVDVVRKFSLSYKDLPFHLYQFSQKFRDERRARGGLLRVREFMMKDGYSFHADEKDFLREYKTMWETYLRIFKRLGLEVVVAESDNGYIGGDYCHEFIVASPVGESTFLTTDDGSYTAHEDVAVFRRDVSNAEEAELPMEVVDAPRGPTIADGIELYKQPAWRQIKTVVYKTEAGEFILAIIRGDLDINEVKLCHILQCQSVEPATSEDIKQLGSVVGFVSPLKLSIKKIGDTSLRTVKNFYTGADSDKKDTLNVNYLRDFTVDVEADIALAKAGVQTEAGQVLKEGIGIEVGNIFQLGKHYSSRMNATYTDEQGKPQHYYMGCYGIGVGRTLATIVEQYNDAKGILWPTAVAPFSVHIVSLCRTETDIAAADAVYKELQNAGVDVLYDDRSGVTAGEKFADSDLIGIPLRVIVSPKTLVDKVVEIKWRQEENSSRIPLDAVVSFCTEKRSS